MVGKDPVTELEHMTCDYPGGQVLVAEETSEVLAGWSQKEKLALHACKEEIAAALHRLYAAVPKDKSVPVVTSALKSWVSRLS
jgi:hypothetical protein